MKFIILDEVDYMTKTAQQALRYLLQTYTENVRFCLICNYISRIDIELQNELLKIHFHELPRAFVYRFLQDICEKENLILEEDSLRKIQDIYKSDLRSMINFLQINQDMIQAGKLTVLHNEILLQFLLDLRGDPENGEWDPDTDLPLHVDQVLYLMSFYNMDAKSFVKQAFMMTIRGGGAGPLCDISPPFLDFVENIVHNPCHGGNTLMYLNYTLSQLHRYLRIQKKRT